MNETTTACWFFTSLTRCSISLLLLLFCYTEVSPQCNEFCCRRTGSTYSGVEEHLPIGRNVKRANNNTLENASTSTHKKKWSEVLAHAFQVHAVRCTTRHTYREDRILRMKTITQDENNSSASKQHKNEVENKQVKKENSEKKKKSIQAWMQETKTLKHSGECADCRILYARKLREGCITDIWTEKTSILTLL